MSSPNHAYSSVPYQDESSRDQSGGSSGAPSREGSRPPREKHRVRFTQGGESIDVRRQRTSFDLRDESSPGASSVTTKPLPRARINPAQVRTGNSTNVLHPVDSGITRDITDSPPRSRSAVFKPSILRASSSDSDMSDVTSELNDDNNDEEDQKAFSSQSARNRAERLSRRVGSHSAPVTTKQSPTRSPPPSPPPSEPIGLPLDLNHVPMKHLETRRKYGIEDDTDEDNEVEEEGQPTTKLHRYRAAAGKLVRHHTQLSKPKLFRVQAQTSPLQSGQTTPTYERDPNDYVPKPKEYREGFLSSILKLYNEQGVGSALSNIPSELNAITSHHRSGSRDSLQDLLKKGSPETPKASPTSSGTGTPKQKHQKWYYKNSQPSSTGSVADLISLSTVLAQPGGSTDEPSKQPAIRPKPKKGKSTGALDVILGRHRPPKTDDSIRIQVHIAETISRQGYLLKLCKALMSYGAPTHRLEEYMRMSARVLEIEGQFLYIPGCMIISFDDASTHTTEVKIVRTPQGIDLGKLRDTHEIYKEVVHDTISVDDAMKRLDEVTKRDQQYKPWFLVLMYGFASASVGPFAFGARPIDLPIAFLLGCLLGIMQLIIAPKSELYTNIFEISAAVLTSFLARAFGSIRKGELFCFSALAQSAIALILPGYTVLCGSLELQSRNIVAGSVRMVYAVIYSLFLGFGITIGTSFYGGIDKHATSDISCRTKTPTWFPFIFVPPFTLCLIIINQGKWKQMPVMLIIAFVGYVVNHFSALRFSSNAQIANTLGALAVGVLGNLYSRLRHGLAAAALLPAIFVQVPSGLAASGSLVSGVTSANQITKQVINGTVSNGTTTVNNATQAGGFGVDVNSMVFNVGYSMIQVAIGITVGLFLSALVVYPFGKRRSGLFSF